jgi:hypothetical protein
MSNSKRLLNRIEKPPKTLQQRSFYVLQCFLFDYYQELGQERLEHRLPRINSWINYLDKYLMRAYCITDTMLRTYFSSQSLVSI